MKINFDVVIFGNNEVGLGCVGCVYDRFILFMVFCYLKVNWNISWVEFVVVRVGVVLVCWLGYEKMIIEGDVFIVMMVLY